VCLAPTESCHRKAANSFDQAESCGLAHRLDAIRGLELVHGVADVLLHGMPAQVEASSDLWIRKTLGDESEDLELLAREPRLLGIAAGREKRGSRPWIDHALACKRPFDRTRKIEVVRVWEQVRSSACIECSADGGPVTVLGKGR